MATPVKRTNGVISTLYCDDFELTGDKHFTAVIRGCPGCKGSLLPYLYPYHLINYDERRNLVKRSPLFPFPFPLAKKKKPLKIPAKKAIKKGPLFGKKGLKKAKKGGPFGKKGLKKAKKGGKKGAPALALGSVGVPSFGLGAPSLGLGGGALAFGIPGTGFGGFFGN